jgi:peptidoglycan/LPS O-acetylase OafA/YrhL
MSPSNHFTPERATTFGGLNSLRFGAALVVLLGHAHANLEQAGILKVSDWIFFERRHDAVNFFFTLSGFLLTSAAMEELKKSNQFNLKNFYIRRALRILPLYYLSVFIGFFFLGFIVPLILKETYFLFPLSKGIPAYLFLYPNYITANYQKGVGALYSLWSIGVEEQFYLFFPFLIYLISFFKKKAGVFLFCLFFGYVFYYYFGVETWEKTTWTLFLETLKFHYMLAGMYLAWLWLQYNERIVSFFSKNNLISSCVFGMVLFYYIWQPSDLSFFQDILFQLAVILLYLLLISVVITANNAFFSLKNKVLNYLGTLSYGIYIYHPYVSYFLRFILLKVSFLKNIITFFPLIYYGLLLFFTIIIAHFSYITVERYFLNLKNQFR